MFVTRVFVMIQHCLGRCYSKKNSRPKPKTFSIKTNFRKISAGWVRKRIAWVLPLTYFESKEKHGA
jgi:hypothetical protein